MKLVKDTIAGTRIHALIHDSRRMYEAFVEAQSKIAMPKNFVILNGIKVEIQSGYASSWYGTPVAQNPDEIFKHEKFLKMDTYREIKREVAKELRKAEKLNQVQNLQTRKLDYNDLGLGVFTFSRAAMSMRKLYKDGKPVLNENGKHKVVSDVKKVYAYRPLISKDKESVKLYILAGGTADVSGDEMIYTGMGAIMIAEYLVENGYDVEINTVLNSYHRDKAYIHIMRMKAFNSELNINDMLLMTASPRWFRYKGFNGIVTAYDHARNTCPNGLGTNVPYGTIKSFIDKLNKDEALPVVLNRTYSKESVIAEVNRVLNVVNKAQKNEE